MVRSALADHFDHVYLLADSSAVEPVREGGFDGVALYDNFVRPAASPHIAHQFTGAGLLFSFNVNAGFDGIPRRHIVDGCCDDPPRLEPPASLDVDSPFSREAAKVRAERRIDDSLYHTLALQAESAAHQRIARVLSRLHQLVQRVARRHGLRADEELHRSLSRGARQGLPQSRAGGLSARVDQRTLAGGLARVGRRVQG